MIACNQCGKCCKKYSNGGLSATKNEIEYWEAHRPDIYKYVRNGNIWLDPDTGQQIELCPWLKKLSNKNAYICGIYNDRPEDCRAYPSTLDEMILDECEMIETHDLLNQQQAKKTLETLMAVDRYPNL